MARGEQAKQTIGFARINRSQLRLRAGVGVVFRFISATKSRPSAFAAIFEWNEELFAATEQDVQTSRSQSSVITCSARHRCCGDVVL